MKGNEETEKKKNENEIKCMQVVLKKAEQVE